MSTQGIHAKVVEAFERDWELLGQMKALQASVMTAKQAEDAVRKDDGLAERMAALKVAYETEAAKLQAQYDAAVAKAAIPYRTATTVYEAAKGQAGASMNQAKEKLTVAYDANRKTNQHDHDMKMAEARATVHRAEQEVAALRTTIDQHRRNIQDRLGIDVAKLQA